MPFIGLDRRHDGRHVGRDLAWSASRRLPKGIARILTLQRAHAVSERLTQAGKLRFGHPADPSAIPAVPVEPRRGGLTSKIHAVVDTNGLPVHLALTPGEAHNNRLCSVLLSALLPQTMLLADRGYDADWIRELARQQGAWANIPPKRNRKDPICFSPYLYRARNLIERFFNKIKQSRRVATRYDKLAANYLAFVKLASIRMAAC